MNPTVPTGSVRESADRICRFRRIRDGGFRAAVEVTRRCNIACLHCFVPMNGRDPDLPALVGVIVGLKQAGCRKVLLTGGEPLLRGDLEQVIRAATEAGMGVDLNSNLVGMDAVRADALVASGLGEASVSFYGNQSFHDAFVRRAGAFDSTVGACRLLRERGVELDIHGPLWADNLSHAGGTYELAESVGAASLTFFKVIAFGGTAGAQGFGLTRFGVDAEQFVPPPLESLRKTIEGLRARGGIPVRTIGFWGERNEECEQGCSIVGLTSDLSLAPCLLSRRRESARYPVFGNTVGRTLELLRIEVQQGFWEPVCGHLE